MLCQASDRRQMDGSSEPEEEDSFSLQGEDVTPHLVAGTSSLAEPTVRAAAPQPAVTLSPAEIEKVSSVSGLVYSAAFRPC